MSCCLLLGLEQRRLRHAVRELEVEAPHNRVLRRLTSVRRDHGAGPADKGHLVVVHLVVRGSSSIEDHCWSVDDHRKAVSGVSNPRSRSHQCSGSRVVENERHDDVEHRRCRSNGRSIRITSPELKRNRAALLEGARPVVVDRLEDRVTIGRLNTPRVVHRQRARREREAVVVRAQRPGRAVIGNDPATVPLAVVQLRSHRRRSWRESPRRRTR